MASLTESDQEMMTHSGTHLIFVANPHRENSQKHVIFENVRGAKTVGEAKELGATQ